MVLISNSIKDCGINILPVILFAVDMELEEDSNFLEPPNHVLRLIKCFLESG